MICFCHSSYSFIKLLVKNLTKEKDIGSNAAEQHSQSLHEMFNGDAGMDRG